MFVIDMLTLRKLIGCFSTESWLSAAEFCKSLDRSLPTVPTKEIMRYFMTDIPKYKVFVADGRVSAFHNFL